MKAVSVGEVVLPPPPGILTVMEEAFADPEKLQGEPAGPALCPILTG